MGLQTYFLDSQVDDWGRHWTDIVHTVDTLDNVKSVNSVDNVSSVNSVHSVHNVPQGGRRPEASEG